MTPFTVTDTGYPTPTLEASGLRIGLHLIDNHNGTGTIAGTTRATAVGVYVVKITALPHLGRIEGSRGLAPRRRYPAVSQNTDCGSHSDT